MLDIRRSSERGHADHGWLKSFHTFSFANYFDPKQIEFGALRVINEDRVDAGAGFGTHSHQNMEIVSYVLEGELAHKDSMGNGSIIRPGDVQRMSAGSGVQHSEFNPSKTDGVHFLQIWIKPNVQNITPSYEEKRFDDAQKRGRLCLLASPAGTASAGENNALLIHQDMRLYAGLFDGDESAQLAVNSTRQVYVHLARGTLEVNGERLEAGDGVKMSDVTAVLLRNGANAEVLVFDLPGSAQ